MRNWWIAFLAGAVVVGCAGGTSTSVSTTSGSGSTAGTTSGSTSGTTGRVVPDVVLPTNTALVNVLFLSGQGRRAPGSQYAQLNNIKLLNGPLTQIPTDITGSLDGINTKLDGYTVNTYGFSQTVSAGATDFTGLQFVLNRIREEQGNGSLTTVYNGPSITLPELPVNVKIAPGRASTVQLYLNDAHLFFDSVLNDAVFDQAEWEFDNLVGGATAVQGFFGDAIAFDLSGLSLRPAMAGGGTADKLLLTGDSVGLARGSMTDGSFDLYSPAFVESGVLTNPVVVGNQTAPGTYTVLEPDPSSVPPAAPRIAALQGPWYAFSDVVRNGGNEVFLVIPSSKAGSPAQCVLLKRSGSTITELWLGRATVNSNGSGTFELWSVDQVDNQTENNKATGSFTNGQLVSGKVDNGDFTVSTTPTGFPFVGTGVYVVYQ